MGQKRGTAAVDAFYGGPVARAKRKKAGDPGVRRRMQGKMGKREGAGMARDSSAASIGRRGCVATGASGGARRVRRVRSGPMGPGKVGARWQRLGAGGSERE
jgi:hypothetical protein